MTTRLGPAGFAAGIHHLISCCLADDLGAPSPRNRPKFEALLPTLAEMNGAPVDPEEDPAGGLVEARIFLLVAERLVMEADRLAAPAIGSEGVLTSRFIDVLTELNEEVEKWEEAEERLAEAEDEED